MHLLDDCSLDAPVSSREAAEAFVARICFKLGPPRLFGVELEWHVYDAADGHQRPALSRVTTALARWLGGAAALPNGSVLSFEPGGQLEISTRPLPGLAACIAAARADAAQVQQTLAAAGLTLRGTGLDPIRPPRRLVCSPRYDAMESYFDRRSSAGRTMMCSTAAVQPCLDAGDEDSFADRWRTLHEIGPALLGAFANSPLRAGRPTGWLSSRYRAWLDIDPKRTGAAPGSDPQAAYANFALEAPLLCIRQEADCWSARPGIRFLDWIADPTIGSWHRPTYGDLAYHLTTLFPPVRAQGHYEVRYLDAQPGDGWIVPVVVMAVLTGDASTRAAARAAAAPARERWVDAARCGPRHPAVARAASDLLMLATEHLVTDPGLEQRVAEFADRYTVRGRCPADDLLEEYR